MTRILMPFRKVGGVSIFDPKTYGGLEKFAKLMLTNVTDHEIHVVEYDDDDVKERRKIDIILDAVERVKPDLIFSNYIEKNVLADLSSKLDIPIVAVIHALGEAIHFKPRFEPLCEFVAQGNTIIMVSEHQKWTWERLAKNLDKPMFDVHGYISPAFCEYSIYNKPEHDIITVGRTDRTKDPFFMHRKFHKTDLDYKIITSSTVTESNIDYQLKYADVPRIMDLPHKDVMEMISKSKVYLSTCPAESWGIVQLEALSCGVPVLCVTRNTSAISSISPYPWGYELVKKSQTTEEFLEAFHRLASLTDEQRMELAIATRQKHSKQAWLDNLNSIIDGAIMRYSASSRTNLNDWME